MKRFLSTYAKESVTVIIIIALFVIALIVRPDLYSSENFPKLINSVILWIPIILTVAMGMMMIIIIRCIDLSVGSMAALTAMITGIMFRDAGLPLVPGILLSCCTGLAFGALNGFLISYINIPAMVVTLGTMNAYRGMTYIISGGTQVTGYQLPPSMTSLVNKGIRLGPVLIPWLVVAALIIAVIFNFVLKQTHFGREVYAVGSNREAAHLRGINCKRITFEIFLLTGLLCGIAGIMYASRYGYVNPSNTGSGLEFTVISATIIGGVSVSGGSGRVPGVLLGCLLLGTLNTLIAMIGIPGTVQKFSYGTIIVLALLIDKTVQVRQQKALIARLAAKEAEV